MRISKNKGLKRIRSLVKRHQSVELAAEHYGFLRQYMDLILAGKRPPSPEMEQDMGIFRRVNKDEYYVTNEDE